MNFRNLPASPFRGSLAASRPRRVALSLSSAAARHSLPPAVQPEAAAVVVDEVLVDPELERVGVDLVRAQHRVPVDASVLKQAVEVAPHVRDLLPLRVDPGGPAPPVAGQLAPQPRSHDAERGMGLGVAVVLVAPHGDDRVALQLLAQEGDDRGDREGVAVDEHDHLVGLGRLGDDVAEQGELQLVLLDRHVRAVEELVRLVAHLRVDPRVDLEMLVEVALQVAKLDVDPAVVAPVDGRDVDHRRVT